MCISVAACTEQVRIWSGRTMSAGMSARMSASMSMNERVCFIKFLEPLAALSAAAKRVVCSLKHHKLHACFLPHASCVYALKLNLPTSRPLVCLRGTLAPLPPCSEHPAPCSTTACVMHTLKFARSFPASIRSRQFGIKNWPGTWDTTIIFMFVGSINLRMAKF